MGGCGCVAAAARLQDSGVAVRRWWLAALAALMLPFAVTLPAGASGERPPECVTVKVVENSGNGPVLWLEFCGSGSGAEPALRRGYGPETVDGSRLTPVDCIRAAPCVLFPARPVPS